MTNRPHTDLGLFPLGIILLPGERVPLHIFEPRYRALVADCVLTPCEFVLTRALDDGVAKVACAARIETLLRRFADGRMNIVVAGTRRVEIADQTSGHPYLSAHVDDAPDAAETVDASLDARIGARFDELVRQVAGAPLPTGRDDVPRSYAIAGAMQLEPGLKQRLLEERSENARLALVDEILEVAIAQTDRVGAGDTRSPTNGDPRLS